MDAQKEIRNQCIELKDHALKMGVMFFDKLLHMSKISMLEENKDDKKYILSSIRPELQLHSNVLTYKNLICTFIFERLLNSHNIYMNIESFNNDISEIIDKIKSTLLMKNMEYGNSALEPLRIFSKANPIEQINVRLDDKLSRMLNDCDKTIKEDTVLDFIGYLILKMIAENVEINNEPKKEYCYPEKGTNEKDANNI